MIQHIPLMEQVVEAESELIKLVVSLLLGAIIGWQREHTGHEAGIRTFSSICMGSCLFGIISFTVAGDPGRIAAQVVSGIGFIGIGVIIRNGGAIKGLTTAATLWSMAAIGLAIAYDLYVISLLATVLIFMSLYVSRTRFWHHIASRPADFPGSVPQVARLPINQTRRIIQPRRSLAACTHKNPVRRLQQTTAKKNSDPIEFI